MEIRNEYLHEVAITAIIIKDGKYLITRRSPNKKRFPGMWTVPGGKMETDDYLKLPKDSEHYWYNVLERTLRREVKEEVGIDIENISYVTSLATIHTDRPSPDGLGQTSGTPSLVISCAANYAGGDISLKENESDQYAWVNLKEAKNYQLLDGIYDELAMVEQKQNGAQTEWRRFS